MLFLRYWHNLSESGYWFERALIPALERFVRASDDKKGLVIDFGCGQKPFAHVFEHYQGSYRGLDVFPGKEVDIVYDGHNLPLESESVDLVFSSSVFEHVENLAHTLREISRVLKPGGMMVSVTPFFNHVHASPYDYHRPTRYGWLSLIANTFGSAAEVVVQPVDTRFNCLINALTGQINFLVFDLLKWLSRPFRSKTSQGLHDGGASPQRSNRGGLRLAYAVVRLNPLHIVLGLISWLVSHCSFSRRHEGEITSGYFVQVVKRV